MRTVAEAVAELRAEDPGTAVTPYFVRQAIASGRLPAIKAGRKILVSLDILADFLSKPMAEQEPARGIRKIGG
jgi:hypothetical protein